MTLGQIFDLFVSFVWLDAVVVEMLSEILKLVMHCTFSTFPPANPVKVPQILNVFFKGVLAPLGSYCFVKLEETRAPG